MPRNKHPISRKNISDNALKVLYRLNNFGYEAYLVGGSVRDLLLGKKPRDFDVSTNATPEQIRKLFYNCYLVGRRFRLAHIIFDYEIIEVSTFRSSHKKTKNNNIINQTKNGVFLTNNIFGNIEDDVIQRDFTINSLYYKINDHSIHDYVGGLKDLKHGMIRLIGDPDIRYREDPVRILRAIRFACTLNMKMDDKTSKVIPKLAFLLRSISSARLFEEFIKLLYTGKLYKIYQELKRYNIFQLLFPLLEKHFTNNGDSPMELLIKQLLKSIDHRIKNNKHVNPAFLFATILWYPMLNYTDNLLQKGTFSYYGAFHIAINHVLNKQCRSIAIPKRFTSIIRDIWQLQLKLLRRRSKKANKILEHSKFHAAFNLLELRAQVEKEYNLKEIVHWWDAFQKANNILQ
ncbi:polynucleotide adenylyltransferase PcnB [Candidatus Arsenophonus lipoptenae]|uniref:polynucleotide adenylyltransferase PcnB n=1 Tax=Candidatus Arsenophonus lipoptenae TaxID=634113 RepID=UPI003AA81CC7